MSETNRIEYKRELTPVLDIVGVLNDQDDYQKNRNYWKYLKTKLKGENSEVVSGTNQLKLLAPDGKCLSNKLVYCGKRELFGISE